MKQPNISSLKKYYNGIKKSKKAYLTIDDLSLNVGVYPEVITNCLIYFEPILALDSSYNLKDLLPPIEKYLLENEPVKNKISVEKKIIKKNSITYDSIADFVYKKMSIGGIVDKNANLTNEDLAILQSLIDKEKRKLENK